MAVDYFLFFCLFAYPLAQFFAIRHTELGWRLLFAVPALPMALVAVQAVLAASDNASVWPVLLSVIAPFAVLYLLVVGAAYRAVGWLGAHTFRRTAGPVLRAPAA